MVDLFKKGREGCLKITDIYKPLPNDESQKLADKLEKYWQEEVSRANQKNCKPNLLRTLCRMFAASYMFCGFLTFLQYVIVRYYAQSCFGNLNSVLF